MSYVEKLEELQRLRAEVRRLERQAEAEGKAMQPLTEQDERAMLGIQARADSAYIAASRRAPPPHAYERPREYERRLVSGLQALSPDWSRADVLNLHESAFEAVRDQVYADAARNGRTAGLKPLEIREKLSESHGGHKVIEFDGGSEAHFTSQFSRPPRIGSFKSQAEYAAMSRDAQLSRIGAIVHEYRPTMTSPRAAF